MCDVEPCIDGGAETGGAPGVPAAQRRAFLRGMLSLPLAVVLADPLLARAAGKRLRKVTVDTAVGGAAAGYLAVPAATPAPAVLLVHEWWGLNDQIKAVAADLARQGFLALAVDLYDGRVATTRADARKYMKAVDPRRATGVLKSSVNWLRRHRRSNGRVGTIGWCFGGGWSLNASLAAPVDATVIYYGNVQRTPADLAPLKGPVLAHFATRDKWINPRMVGGFERAMSAAGKSGGLVVHWYVADHAFANPSGGRYDDEDAKLAMARTLSFLNRHLRGG